MNPEANILIMGDFNDTPTDKSIQTLTKSANNRRNLINLFGDPQKLNYYGTYKFQNEWSQLDQMMISANWNKYLKAGSPQIFVADFLLTKKNSRGEQGPYRVYTGTIFRNGYSDHLPVVADFLLPLPK